MHPSTVRYLFKLTHVHLLAASYIFITTFVHAMITLHCLLAAAHGNVNKKLYRMGEKDLDVSPLPNVSFFQGSHLTLHLLGHLF